MELPSLLSELLVLCVEGFFVRFLAFLLEILGASTSSFRLTAQLGNMMSPGVLAIPDVGFIPFLFSLRATESSTFNEDSGMVLLIRFLPTNSHGRSTT